ncbi:MAG: hypothetical protein NW206_10230 [Hyphomonadaceae bacterium]|nr:hypothetical protein [Hyphomonadaceae bacterium]
MLFLDYTNYDATTIRENLGAPEYSYFFVRNAFQPVFEQLGAHISVTEPEREVEEIYRAARARGEQCALFAFCPPNTMPVHQKCPIVPVFAWEYDTLPDESCNDSPAEDWTAALRRAGMAITHSRFAAEVVRRTMGADYPVWDIPAPIFDKFKRPENEARGWRPPFEFVVEGGLAINASDIDLSRFSHELPNDAKVHALRVLDHVAGDPARRPQTLQLEGVIYSTVLNPYDGRKNWRDLIGAFVWAFRDVPTATLIVKVTRHDVQDGVMPLLQHLSALGSFECKVVIVHGMLSNAAYLQLINSSSYAVNASYGEGQCLPLMEYMSAGRPAVAPAHTAMLDYVTPDNAFIIASDARPTHWPHDRQQVRRCNHYKVRFDDLVRQFQRSYAVAKGDPALYARMSAAAVKSLRAFCSEDVARLRLRDVVAHLDRIEPPAKSKSEQGPRSLAS